MKTLAETAEIEQEKMFSGGSLANDLHQMRVSSGMAALRECFTRCRPGSGLLESRGN